MFIVITETNSGGPPTASYCNTVRDSYGISAFPVLYDPLGSFESAAGLSSPNAWTIVIDEEVKIQAKDKFSQSTAFSVMESLLTAE